MRKILLFAMLVACTGMKAQQDEPYTKKLMLDITMGANIDMPGSSDNPAAELLGTRQKCALAYDLRFSHLFSRHWGWYADVRIKFFKEFYNDNYLNDNIAEAVAKVLADLFCNLNWFHPAVHGGVVYRWETERWRIYPRIGIGVNCGAERNKTKSDITTSSKATTLCSEAGLSTHYMLSKNISLLLDVEYQQPLTKAKASITKTEQGNTACTEYRTSTFGREVNVSAGISLHF